MCKQHAYFQDAAYFLLAEKAKKELHKLIGLEYEVCCACSFPHSALTKMISQITLSDKELEPYFGVLGPLLHAHLVM